MICHNVERAFQHPDVRIGWYPHVAIAETEVRTAPGAGTLLKTIPKTGGLGWQSTRNPQDQPLFPHKRPIFWKTPTEGYAFCYTRAGSVTGWVREADIAPDPLSYTKPPLNGPGGYDFEVGRTEPRLKKANGCGKVSRTKPLRVVDRRDLYLRYSGRGTAFHYLHRGDIVRLLLVDAIGGYGFIEVVSCSPRGPVHPGYRGWLEQAALAPIAQ